MTLQQEYLNNCKNDFKAFRRLLIIIIILCISIIILIASCRPKVDFKNNIIVTYDSTISMNDSVNVKIINSNIYIISGTDTLVKSE
jgi:hypothetical protein